MDRCIKFAVKSRDVKIVTAFAEALFNYFKVNVSTAI